MALMTPYAVQAHALLAVVLSDSAFPPRSMLLFYYLPVPTGGTCCYAIYQSVPVS